MTHLVLDVETNSRNANKADLKVFGGYDLEEGSFYIKKYEPEKVEAINKKIKLYDWVITFNGNTFDVPVLERHNIKYPFWKNIDLYQVCKKRAKIINEDGFDSFSLRNIIKTLKLDDEGGKGDIDYNVFMKDEWTEEEKAEIVKYLKQDLFLTAKLWNFLYDRFSKFSEFIPEKDAKRYKHITTSAGSFAYKAICYKAGIDEIYDHNLDHEKFDGAFVAFPSKESARGTIVILDFASLYPMLDTMANLFSHSCKCCAQEEKWHGSELFKVKGYYCKKELGKIERVIREFFLLRKAYKAQGDTREYVIKIIINSLYGISGNEAFVQLYNINTASDTTSLGQQAIKYARSRLNQEGYGVLYSDTDSAYIEVPSNKTVEDLKKLAADISKTIASQFPFCWDEFNFKVEDVIKYVQFFPKDGNFKKKNYLYVKPKYDKQGNFIKDVLVIKGLMIKKLNCSELSKKVFKILEPQILQNLDCKFDRSYIVCLLKQYLQEDITLGLKRFNVQEEYKGDTSIQNQILKRYGDGEVMLIKNFKVGAGKGVKYCTIEEAKELRFEDLDLEVYLKELDPFIKGKKETSKGGLSDYI